MNDNTNLPLKSELAIGTSNNIALTFASGAYSLYSMILIFRQSIFLLGIWLLMCGCSVTTKPDETDSGHSGGAEAKLARAEVLRLAREHAENQERVDLSRYPRQEIYYEFGGRKDSWIVSFSPQDTEIRDGGFSVTIDDQTGEAHIAHPGR